MEKERTRKVKNERGSATIEAVVGFTAFLFAIFTILGMTNFCRAQMMVSAAMDTAAKEMSQYAYFYEMSGLKKFETELDENAEVGKGNINDVIGTVDQLYSSFNGAVSQTVQDQTNVANMLASGNVELSGFENAISNLENSADGVMQGITGVSNAIGDIGNDPLKYMRSVVALIGSETMEVAKRAVAVPLTKVFVSKHFGSNTEEANEALEALGIEGGLDAMNFNLSKIFADENHQDIELTVFYKVKLFQVFDWVVLEADISKVATCRAWLGGDTVLTKAKGNETPPASSDTEDKTEQDGETSEEEKPEEEKPEEEETKQPIDTTGSYWHLGDGGYGIENAGRDQAFQELYYEEYNIDTSKPGYYNQQKDKDGAFSGNLYHQVCVLDSSKEEFDAAFYLGELHEIQNQIKSGTLPETAKSLTYIVYVPENISDEEYKKMKENASEGQLDCQLMLSTIDSETKKQYADIGITVQIIKAGGNYDYESEEK